MDTLSKSTFEKIRRERRSRSLALAFLKRAKAAGIPDKYLRIRKDRFKGLLSVSYHKDVDVIANFVYDNTAKLVKTPYVLIDGGDQSARTMAGFAILFRMIVSDKIGLYRSCSDLYHKLSTWHILDDMHRNKLADMLKDYDVLFISEFHANLFKPKYDTGTFFDEILTERYNHNRPTIISFTQALSKESRIQNAANCGSTLASLTHKVYSTSFTDEQGGFKSGNKKNPTSDVLRVRVEVAND